MIAGIRGKVFQKRVNSVLVEANGVIYEVIVSLNSFSQIKDEVFLYISEIIREDSYNLYGFCDENEQKMFDTLIKINGVGPKVALAICSTFDPITFANIIHTKNISALKKVPGIGVKSANRIVVELGEFSVESANSITLDAIEALEGLGFKKDDIVKTIKNIKASSTEELIKQTLKKLATF